MKTSFAALAFLAGASAAEEKRDWRVEGDQRISDIKKQFKYISTDEARNVILFIADGNGINTNYGTRLFQGQMDGGYGDEFELSHEKMPWVGMVKTYNSNAQTPDSAGTATAMNSGHKTKAGVIGVSEDAIRGDCSTLPGNELELIAQQAKGMNKKVGVVSTARITHATPAGVYARSVDRNFESEVPEGCTEQVDIAQQQLVLAMVGSDPWVDFAAGGGKSNFYNSTEVDAMGEFGDRADGRDLIAEAADAGVMTAQTKDEFMALDFEDGDGKVLGLFTASHLSYDHDRLTEGEDSNEPSIMEMTKAAIDFLSKNHDGYYLMVEAGRVDHASHAGNMHRTFQDGIAYQEAVQYAMDNTDPTETLIISTADHGHAIAFNGYCGRGSPVTGLCMEIDPEGTMHAGTPNFASDGSTYTVVSVGNGPGSVFYEGDEEEGVGQNLAEVSEDGVFLRPNVTNDEAMDPDYIQQSLVPLDSETHSGADVAVYAQGPWSHLMTGVVEQTHIYDVMWCEYSRCQAVDWALLRITVNSFLPINPGPPCLAAHAYHFTCFPVID
ncbi:unnamed protein product [Scytosiphon promiscuus]